MEKNLKIAMFGHKRIPSREGGVEIVVEELSTRMVALGNHVTCYNRKGHHIAGTNFDNSTKSNLYKGVRLKSVCTINKKGLAAMSSSFFASIKAALGPYDVVHVHAEGPCAMLWILKLRNKKCIVTIHGLDWARSKWGGFATKYIKFGEKCAVKYADSIIVLSKNVQNYFKDTYNRETVFIPNGVTKPILVKANEITKKFELKKDSYYLFLARIVPEKGIHYLIEAFKKVKTDKKLVIAGGSSDTDNYLNNLYTLASDDDRIIFTGFVQGKILEELYSNAYVYVLPSDLEGMPLSLLEALSYGNCVLGSDINEITEVVENKAILFKQSNVTDLQNKLQYLEDNKDVVTQYKEGASDFICTKYNWDDVTEKTLKTYKEEKE
ncbi:MAG: glycosyl transferase family 1 [Treponema sp. CETP13]|nr:MAG: glycosyl transferase family 1 [Treponema sp. CETP13]